MKKLPIYEVMIRNYPKFLIIANDDVEIRMQFEVHEVLSWECDKSNTPIDTELYLSGVIKWDGCSHLYFGNQESGMPDGYIHLCGEEEWIAHNIMMEELYQYAADTIERYDREVANQIIMRNKPNE